MAVSQYPTVLCFKPQPHCEPEVALAQDLGTITRLVRQEKRGAEVRKSKAVERVLEEVLWNGMKVDIGNVDLQVPLGRSVHHGLLHLLLTRGGGICGKI